MSKCYILNEHGLPESIVCANYNKESDEYGLCGDWCEAPETAELNQEEYTAFLDKYFGENENQCPYFKMPNEKLCPLRDMLPCRETECAWWKNNDCAIASISIYLAGIFNKLV
jgi:hypothetical protein